jgi:hypothetical protein
MRKKPKDGLISSRKSVWFYSDMVGDDPILNNKSFYHYSSNTNMIIDDVDSSCLPIPDFPKNKYKVNLITSDSRCEDLLIGAIETRYGRENLTNSIYEFFNQCVRVVMTYGYAGYEIIYFSTQDGKIDSFWLSLIPPSAFIIKKDKFQQYVPLEIVNERDLEGQYIDLPKNDVLLFEIPEYIKSDYEQMMESLAFLGKEVFPDFALENIFKPTIPFSQSDYLLSKEIALAKATRVIGWNARNYSNEYKFEHYVWQRQLRFHKFLCILRETILKTLNEGLKRIGNNLDFEAKLVIEGLPTVLDAENALEKLKNGEIKTFSEVLDIFR